MGSRFWLFAKKKLKNWVGRPVVVAAGLEASRNIPLFAVVAIPELDRYYNQTKRLIPKQLPRLAKYILRAMVVVLIGSTIYFLYRQSYLALTERLVIRWLP